MKNNHKPYKEMSIWHLLRIFIISRLPKRKQTVSEEQIAKIPEIPEKEVNYIAIVLDGVVEDVMRAQNRLAALLLSNPTFVEFDPKKDKPQIGETKYVNGNFEYPQKELMTDQELTETLKSMQTKEKNEN